MKGSIGCPTRIITHIPHARYLSKHQQEELSKTAKHRLSIIDWYHRKSEYYATNGKPSVSVTCRHFGIHRSYFYRWYKRYNKHRLSTLENKTTTPNKKRQVEYSRDLVEKVRELRKADPSYSGKKLRPILLRTMKEVPSVATLGRLIRREQLFFRADVSRRKKKQKSTTKTYQRIRKPYGLKPSDAKKVIEFDMKHIYLLGTKLYAFCAINVLSREAVIHIATTSTSRNAKVALEKTVNRFGKQIFIVCDNGSENMKDAEQYLISQEIIQYWTHPHAPKEKPYVERFIGTLQKECLDYHYEPMNATETMAVVNDWLDKYHHYRPHEALDFLTPAEYSDTLGIAIPHCGLSY
ncbi:MAG: integrase core domain-containing protein, partial [Treponema sp.]|nr:integrase core domain-containing protein [Treponema sp.]